MTKPEAIAQLVPQTYNVVSAVLFWFALFGLAAFAAYFAFAWLVCWLDDKSLTRKVNRSAVR